MKKINVGLLGFGTVGSGVVKILIEKKELIESRVGAEINLKLVADIETETDRGIKLEKSVFISDPWKVVTDPEIDIVIEAIGGCGIAKDLIIKAIENNKQVVTANKALIAEYGNDIFKRAVEKRVDIAFEASVGGCIPVIKTIRESLAGDRIKSVVGILNGTSNYILTRMTYEKLAFKDALFEAQANGYAEADPTLDIEGIDAAHKLAIISTIAYGARVNMKDIFVEGISNIHPIDIKFAEEFKYRIKLLAITKENNNAIEARVHPAMVPFDNILSNVNGSLNAITISGDAVGDIVLNGRGAGSMPTAAAILSDTIDLARNLIYGAVCRVPPLSYRSRNIKTDMPVLSMDEVLTNYYFRFAAKDKPGVLSNISGILGNFGISIKSVQQKGLEQPATLVMLTHQAKEADVRKALKLISDLDSVCSQPVVIRVEKK